MKPMRRDDLIRDLESRRRFDLIVIGGGATGLGVAVEAASRGLVTALLEKHDFCRGTSSRSTKLVHGGVRYLAQGNITLVIDALKERGRLLRNAPHLVERLPMIVPTYRRWDSFYYGTGLKLYDILAGRLGLGKTQLLSRDEVLRHLPTLAGDNLRGGVLFYDGQFDDARLGISLARLCRRLGGCLANYVEVTGLIRRAGRVSGVQAREYFTGREFEIEATVLVNATGTSADRVRAMADPEISPRLTLSRGSHVVLPAEFLGGSTSLLVPKTEDGRVLFAIPWHGRTLAGTTDVPVDDDTTEPVPSAEEIEFILHHLGLYLSRKPPRSDVLSVFAGLRPLVGSGSGPPGKTAALSRDHTIEVIGKRLISVMGGKWTTYRKMAEDTVDRAIQIGRFTARPSQTAEMPIDVGSNHDPDVHLRSYGSGAAEIRRLTKERPELDQLLVPALPYRKAEVVWAARAEWAWRLEDVLARRTRSLLLDARASIEAAPEAARLMAAELGEDETWRRREIEAYRALAEKYLI